MKRGTRLLRSEIAVTLEHEPYSDGQVQAWERLVVVMRQAITHAVQIDAPLATLSAITHQLESVVATLAAHSGAKPVPRFRIPLDPASPDDYHAYSPVSGKLNPIAPPVTMSVEAGRLISRVTLGPAYEGGVGIAHGGVVSMIWDQMLALANVVAGVAGPTGELRVRYRAPTPLGQELRFEAWHDRIEGRRLIALGRCTVGETLVSEAEGVFIALDQSKLGRGGWAADTQIAGTRPERRESGGSTS